MRGWHVGVGLLVSSLLLGGIVGARASGSPSEATVRLVHDFFPGEFAGERPLPHLTQLGNALFFIADDLETGRNLWRTDGSPAGTRRVPITGHAGPSHSAILGRVGPFLIWVSSIEGENVSLLLSSTEGGDGIVLRSYELPGSQHNALSLDGTTDSYPILGRRLFFQECTTTRCTVWSTDGTNAGTRPVRALAQLTAPDQEIVSTLAGRWLVLRSRDALLAYDVPADRLLTLMPRGARWISTYPAGETLFILSEMVTSAGSSRSRLWASRLDSPPAIQLFHDSYIGIAGWRGGLLYFASYDHQLWSTDGRRENTRPYSGVRIDNFGLLASQLGSIGSKTLIPMPGYYWGGLLGANESKRAVRELHHLCSGKQGCLASDMSAVTVADDRAFLTIRGSLWQSDGTLQGTKAHEVLAQADVTSFRVLNDRLLLGATSHQGEQQLWETDGTAQGTRALSDGTLDRPFRVQGRPAPLGDALIAAADRNPLGQQLWSLADGRATPLTDLRHVAAGFDPFFALPLGDRVLLGGRDSSRLVSLAADHSTEEIPAFPTNYCSFYEESCATEVVEAGGRLLFVTFGSRLWSTDGTAASSGGLLREEDDAFTPVAAMGRWRDQALVVGQGGGLWTSDGTAEGTRFITRLPADVIQDVWIRPLGPPLQLGLQAFLFLRVPSGADSEVLELWRTDGTAAGTVRLASTPFPETFAPYLSPAVLGDRLFFRFGGTLWMSDGSAAGTRPLQNQLPGGTFALAAGTTKLYAAAGYLDDDDEHQALWAIDAATLEASLLGTFRRVADGQVGTTLGSVLGDTLFFRSVDEHGVERWWITEGTTPSTHPVPSAVASNPVAAFFSAGDRRYFTACETEHGCELWSTDRLGEDTRRVTDLWPGRRGSNPNILAVTSDALWFAATEPTVGRELWKLDLPDPTP